MNTTTLQQAPIGPPCTLFTTRGFVPEALLSKQVVVEEYPDATVTAHEFYIGAELVRRDVNLALKPKALFDLQAKEL